MQRRRRGLIMAILLVSVAGIAGAFMSGCYGPATREETAALLQVKDQEAVKPDDIRLRGGQAGLPVAVAVTVHDLRPSYHPGSEGFAFLPLVPFAESTYSGTPEMMSGGQQGTIADNAKAGDQELAIADYADIIPFLIAQDLRNTHAVMHAGCEQDNSNLAQYELVLELTFRDAHYEEGTFFYGLSLPGDLLWLFGLPSMRVAAYANLDWRLYVQATQEVVGSGEAHCERSQIVGFYYGGSGKEQTMRPFVIQVVGDVCSGVRNSLASKPLSEWARIAKAHEEWRVAHGETPSYMAVLQKQKEQAELIKAAEEGRANMVLFALEPSKDISVPDWTNVVVAWKTRHLDDLLSNAKADELKDLVVRIEQTILQATNSSEREKDFAQKAVASGQGGEEGHLELARAYRLRIDVLKPILAAIKDELANRAR